jgi:hypothetical protein
MGQCEHGTFAQNIDILGNNTTKKLKKYTQNYENRCFLIRDWVAEIYFWAVGRALLGSPMGDPLNNCKYLFSNKMLSDKKHIG